MSTETELESLVVRLVGDGSDYEEILRSAVEETRQAVEDVEHAAKDAMAAQNRALADAARITEAVATPTERYAVELANLQQHLDADRISTETYIRSMQRMQSELPQNVQALDAYNRELQEGHALTKAMQTAEETHAGTMARYKALLDSGIISQTTYDRAVKASIATTGAAKAAEDAHNQSLARAKSLYEATRNPAEQYAARLKELDTLYKQNYVDANTYDRALKQLNSDFIVNAEVVERARVNWQQLGGQIQQAGGIISQAGSMIRGVGQTLSLAVTAPIIAAGAGSLKAASDAQQAQVAFTVMLGSGRKAVGMLADIRKMAASTPFDTPTLRDAGKLLLNYGVAGKEILPTLRMLGDVSAGDANKLHSLSVAFGQMSSTGRLMGQDLLQMINAGFNPLQEISKRTGESMEALKARMEAGGIASSEVTQAFKDATSQGGRFNGMMDKISKTLAGRWSTFIDNISELGITIGEILMPYAEQLMEWAIGMVAYLKDLSPEAKMVGVVLAAIAAALGPALVLFGSFVGLVGAAATAIGGLLAVGWPVIAWVAGITAGVTLLVAAATAAGAALAYLVYQSVGAEGLSKMWADATQAASQFFWKLVGFIYNFRQNWTVLTTWLPQHWGEVVADLVNMFAVAMQNMGANALVGVRMIMRMWIAYQGWWIGMLRNIFTTQFLKQLAIGLMAALHRINEWRKMAVAALNPWSSYSSEDAAAFGAMLGKDMMAGYKDQNLGKSLTNIFKDEMKNFKSPLDGFQSSITKGPDFNFFMPTGQIKQGLAVIEEGAAAASKTLGRLSQIYGSVVRGDTINAQAQAGSLLTDTANLAADAWAGVADAMGLVTTATSKLTLEQAKLNEDVKELTGNLKKQLEVAELEAKVGEMNTEQKKVAMLVARGATEAATAEAKGYADRIAAIEADTKERERAAKIAEKYVTPAEKYARTQKELKSMLDKGLISLAAYNYELKEAREEMNKDLKVKFKMEGFDAVEFGSLAMLERFEEYKRALEEPIEPAVPTEYSEADRMTMDLPMDPDVAATPIEADVVATPADDGTSRTVEELSALEKAMLDELVKIAANTEAARGGGHARPVVVAAANIGKGR